MQTLSKNNSRTTLMSNTEILNLMYEILERARFYGATDAIVCLNYDSGFSVDVRMREVETVAFNEDKAINLVSYINHSKGAASSTDTSSLAIDELVKASIEIAKVSAQDPCFGLPDRQLMTKTHPNLDLFHPWNISPEEAIKKALACEARALSLDKRISNSDGVNFSSYAFCSAYANTIGGEGIIHSTRHNLSCSLIAKQDESMQRDYDYTTARDKNNLKNLETVAQNAVENTVSRLGAKKIKTQKTPVIFSSRISSSLLSHFISAISGSNLYKKKTHFY